MDSGLTHLAADGGARMVDVGSKALTFRRAVASARVVMRPGTRAAALERGPKGPVIEVARLAGIQGAKRCADLVPLCHTVPIDSVDLRITPEGENVLVIEAEVKTTWRTGVEMEALTAVTVAGLTVIDMLKALERELVITDVRLEEKSGGRSGTWVRGAT